MAWLDSKPFFPRFRGNQLAVVSMNDDCAVAQFARHSPGVHCLGKAIAGIAVAEPVALPGDPGFFGCAFLLGVELGVAATPHSPGMPDVLSEPSGAVLPDGNDPGLAVLALSFPTTICRSASRMSSQVRRLISALRNPANAPKTMLGRNLLGVAARSLCISLGVKIWMATSSALTGCVAFTGLSATNPRATANSNRTCNALR